MFEEEEKNNLIHTFNNFVSEYRDRQSLHKNYEMAIKGLNFASQLVYIYDYANKKIVYSKGFDSLLGIKLSIKTTIDLYKLVHPDDIKRLLIAVKISMMVADTLPIEHIGESKLFIDYRLRKSTGEYIRIFRQSSVLEVNNLGASPEALFTLFFQNSLS